MEEGMGGINDNGKITIKIISNIFKRKNKNKTLGD